MNLQFGDIAIGLGTFPFSNVFGFLDDKEAEYITHTFLDHGGKYIQTAPNYKGVDPLMGKILKKVERDKFLWGTLCVKDRQSSLSGKYASVIAQCNDSLKQTGFEYIDLYMTSTTKAKDSSFAETIEAMLYLKDQGKVREIGVCNVTLSQLEEYNQNRVVKYVQNRFSLIDQKMDEDVRVDCCKNGIGLVPYNVIEWGLLTNKILKDFTLRDKDVRKQVLPVFNNGSVQVLREWALSCLKPIADETHTSIEVIAIYWALSQPGVSVCPIGATRREQIESSLKVLKLTERSDVLVEINKAYLVLESKVKDEYGMNLNDFLKNSYGKR